MYFVIQEKWESHILTIVKIQIYEIFITTTTVGSIEIFDNKLSGYFFFKIFEFI